MWRTDEAPDAVVLGFGVNLSLMGVWPMYFFQLCPRTHGHNTWPQRVEGVILDIKSDCVLDFPRCLWRGSSEAVRVMSAAWCASALPTSRTTGEIARFEGPTGSIYYARRVQAFCHRRLWVQSCGPLAPRFPKPWKVSASNSYS